MASNDCAARPVGAGLGRPDKAKGNTSNYNTSPATAKPIRSFSCAVPGCGRAGAITRAVTGPRHSKPDLRKWYCSAHYSRGAQ
jgi:hypothetical protein